MVRAQSAKRGIVYVFAVAAVGAAASYAGLRLRRRLQEKRAATRREELLDQAISETMDASDPVAKY